MGSCIMQALIYIWLLAITCLHSKAAVVTKLLVKSICLVYNLATAIAGTLIIMLIMQVTNFTWCNKFIITFPTILSILIHKFLTFFEDKS